MNMQFDDMQTFVYQTLVRQIGVPNGCLRTACCRTI